MMKQEITLGGGATTATPGSYQIANPALFDLKWGDYMYQREHAQNMRYLEMPDDQWRQGVAGHLAAHPNNPAVRRWVAQMEAERTEHKRRTSQRVSVEVPDSDELTLRVWKDMIENPCMYGDDIVEWLDLNEQVMRGPKRWRAGAYWQKRQDEEDAKEWKRVLGLLAKAAAQQEQWREEARIAKIAEANALATRIQAAWRGYSTRVKQVWRDCAHCLKHGICVETIGEEHVCRCCWGEANPVEDTVVTPMAVEEN
jgi:hypothetical protein